MKYSYIIYLKNTAIVNILDFITTKKLTYISVALENIEKLAKYYNISLRCKVEHANTTHYLKQFITNEKGYIETLPHLYNSLKLEQKLTN